jgi:hypothetical protein
MSSKLNKDDIHSLLNFIQDGFLVHDVYFLNTYLTFRSLTKTDRQIIHLKFKYLGVKFNLFLVLDILSKSIYRIGGIRVDEESVRKKLQVMNQSIVMQIYEQYNIAEEKFDSLFNNIEKFVNTNESRNLWQIYKMTLNVEKLDEHQYFWALLNINKDKTEQYRFDWSKIEYMTNSICAFINPKEFKRLKNQMNITRQFEEQDIEGPFEIEEQDEKEEKVVDLTKRTINGMVKREDENQQDYYRRVSETLVEINKGKITDEHDQIVRDYEIGILKKMLKDRRTKTEVATTLRSRSELMKNENLNIALSKDGVYHEEASYVGDDVLEAKLSKELQKEGFFFKNNSYADIATDRFFASIPLSEKQKVFEEIMNEKIDVEIETEKYLKNASKGPQIEQKEEPQKVPQNEQKEALKAPQNEKPMETITPAANVARSDLRGLKNGSEEAFKDEAYFDETEEEFIKKEQAAFKAANMKINLDSEVKIVKNTPRQINEKIIENNKKFNTDDDIDQIIIK